ncbi:MAG: hypothetical protein IJE28_07460 [Oscillospiraceae bacterium]|nr:hypothetical protein [Oscillospiraceae bacterium]MBQ3501577.1 hypothetical protein [Oscillospiraceae bacterium]MBQ4643417.1 hypothetical protein [Oscillospiraceae bacterium]
MAEQAIFKSQTFGGFNKEEVLKYIDKLNADFTEEHDRAEEEISAMKTELDEKNARLSEVSENFGNLKSKYDEIMEAYEELRQHYLMLKEHSDNIEAENEKLSARLGRTEKELAIEKEVHSQLEAKLEEEKQKALEHAAKEHKLAIAIDAAGDSARMMLASAKTGAQNIIADAQNTADGINSEIDEFREELLKTKDFMQDSLSVLIQRLEYIEKNAENAKIPSEERTSKSAEIQKKYEELVSETEMKTAALKERFFR